MNNIKEQENNYNPSGMPEDASTTISGRTILPEDLSQVLQEAILRLAEFAESFSTTVPEDYIITQKELTDLTNEQKEARVKLFERLWAETEEILEEDPAELFNRQCLKEKQKDPRFNRGVFASMEKKRTEAVFRKFDKLPELDDLYTKNPAYKLVLSYINYLDNLPVEKDTTPILQTFKGKHTPEQRNTIRLRLIKEKCIEPISEEDFEYLFSEIQIFKGMPRIIFLKPASHAKRLLLELVEDFENKETEKYNISEWCITIKSGKRLDSNTRIAKKVVFGDIFKLD